MGAGTTGVRQSTRFLSEGLEPGLAPSLRADNESRLSGQRALTQRKAKLDPFPVQGAGTQEARTTVRANRLWTILGGSAGATGFGVTAVAKA